MPNPLFARDDYILLSNDDGFFAPGLKLLEKIVKEQSDYAIFAPNVNRSGASSALSLQNPITITAVEDNIFAVVGTPADCVHVALNGLVKHMPKKVLTGINAGANLGDDVLYSGTVAAALEARFLPTSNIAFSITNHHPKHWETAEYAVREVLKRTADLSLPQRTILNVNIPDVSLDELKGFRITRLGQRTQSDDLHELINPRGTCNYWIGLSGNHCKDDDQGTDFQAIAEGYVSITPIHVDMTQFAVMDQVSELF